MMVFMMGNGMDVSSGVMMSCMVPRMMSFVSDMARPSMMVPFLCKFNLVMRFRRGSRFSAARRPEPEEQRRSEHDCRCQIYPFFHKCHRLFFFSVFILVRPY
jgi:hypothetical protein